ncbi:ABC transporter ATP-binding protein [Levilactobacillus tongjiangensis]|uniref:ABC transporter ATP-binding protein n=1 Tax=Levilactobacillus tongjiangensis TaxID=2486023 RepID=A0ABW1SRT8_9LACO|nr:ABC transporter ATP-binding protein [Levilactobacillus tongjiangensis]
MSELMSLKQVTFTYPAANRPALDGVDLHIASDDFMVIVGATGSGKTTLLRQLKPELVPAGDLTGTVQYQGRSIQKLSATESAQTIGVVAQDPVVQPVMATVIEELAFSLENVGVSASGMPGRIAEIANFLGLDQILHTPLQQLSGGQLQLVNLASVLVLHPAILLLDEPTAQLDPTTAQNFLNVLQQVHRELGITIVMSEHRLDRILPLANRLVIMEDGALLAAESVATGLRLMSQHDELASFVPAIPNFFVQQHLTGNQLPLTVATGRRMLSQQDVLFKLRSSTLSVKTFGAPLLTVAGVSFHYDQQAPTLRTIDITFATGIWVAILGKNGAGKSTLLSVLAGLRKPQHGKVRLGKQIIWKMKNSVLIRQVGLLSQHPIDQFTGLTVREELTAQSQLGNEPVNATAVTDWLAKLQLTAVADQNVFDLSGGQQQLVGLGLALITRPRLLLLDEPTKGLDPATKQVVGRLLETYRAAGVTIVMASHDVEFSAQFATHGTFMFDGQLTPVQPARKFFTTNFMATTAVSRLLRQWLQQALFSTDVERKGGANDQG